MIFLTGVHSLV